MNYPNSPFSETRRTVKAADVFPDNKAGMKTILLNGLLFTWNSNQSLWVQDTQARKEEIASATVVSDPENLSVGIG